MSTIQPEFSDFVLFRRSVNIPVDHVCKVNADVQRGHQVDFTMVSAHPSCQNSHLIVI